MQLKKASRTLVLPLVSLALVCFAVLLVGICPQHASAATSQGWNTAHTKYYVNGRTVTGVKKIGKNRYVFKSSGKLATWRFTKGVTTFYPTSKGVLRACRQGKNWYYANGKKMTSFDALDARAYFAAGKILSKITKKSDSKATKRLKAFKWVMKQRPGLHHKWSSVYKIWPPIYAMDHFNNKGGDCESDAAAFAYLAAACGYKNVYACTDSASPHVDSHAWCRINGAVFDPMFAYRSFSTFYNSRHGSYEVTGGVPFKIVTFSSKHASKHAAKIDLSNPNKNLWVKKGSHWRYYTATGKCARGSVKCARSYKSFKKGIYYVFSSKGFLLRGKKARVVEVSGKKYRIRASGAAYPGWSKGNKRLYLKSGALATGIMLVKEKLTVFSSSGLYCPKPTSDVRAAARKGQPFAKLEKLLADNGAQSSKRIEQTSCITYNGSTGRDVLHAYPNFSVSTFIMDTTGEEVVLSISQ